MATSIGDSGPYSGEVTPGGSPDTRELAGLVVTKLAVDPKMSNNCYLLRCRATDEQVLIDAAAEPERLLELIGPSGLSRVITTHQHWDHHRALEQVAEATGAVVVAGADDADAITEQTGVTVDQRVGEDDRIQVGTCSLLVIPVAGHTPGSICLLYDDSSAGSGRPHLFTGDSLFPGGVGNTQGDPDRFAQLIGDVSSRIFDALPDETWFYPGHGNDSTLGVERPHVEEWRARGW
jgi:glyoxylase-like metal-dependent hydrolase (beta-lactamase superfamily II)